MDAAQFLVLRHEPLHGMTRMRRIIRESGDYGPRVDADRVEAFYAGMTRG
jgi:hypothetical protein